MAIPTKPIDLPPEILAQATPVKCHKCHGEIFVLNDTHHQVKRIPGHLLGREDDGFVFPAVRYCARCNSPIKTNDAR
jgi:hypothetical protein